MPTKIAFVSCAFATYRRHQPAWTDILAARPDVLLMLGDNAYMAWDGQQDDPADWDFAALEECYRLQFDVADFRRLIAAVPTLAIWDDHDSGPNDTQGARLPPDYLRTVREKFDRWMGFTRNNNRPHMYCSYLDLPDVQVLMLDGRSFRTLTTADGATMLGEAQEDWLWSRLDPTRTPQRKFTLVCLGTGFTEGKGSEQVRAYPSFADRLKQHLSFRPGGGDDPGRRALFVAGDIHRNVFRTMNDVGLHEVMSSGVACFQTGTDEDGLSDPANFIDKWGLITIGTDTVDIDFNGWTQPKPGWPPEPRRVTIRVVDWQVVARS
jgi:PhoD-like phosphatase